MPVTMERPRKTTMRSRSSDELQAPGTSPIPSFSASELVRARFPAEPISVPRSRRFVEQLLARAEPLPDGSFRTNAVLLTSELVTNAVIHARTWFEISVRTGGRYIRVEVADTNEVIPQIPEIMTSAEHGRGLRIVDGIASSWGVEPGHPGKTVWFELQDSA